LNHPNIAAIHGLEDADFVLALVLELAEGPTLADRLQHGALALDEALPIARQIAEALEAAHERGIVHRDLKPANVKVRPDGTVKVLDFGLAKALEGDATAADVSQSPTLSVAATRAGVILGTAAYMAPEQARGKAVDKRADIWAFGCVLYEMLTGRRAFGGEEITDTLAFIITKEPNWTALPKETPPAVHRLLRRCLTKDRRNRLPDIGVARLEIDDALDPAHAVSLHPPRRGIAAIAAAALAAAALTGSAAWILRPDVDRPVRRFAITLSPGDQFSAQGRHLVAI
jgi:serine/threonine protein kinase